MKFKNFTLFGQHQHNPNWNFNSFLMHWNFWKEKRDNRMTTDRSQEQPTLDEFFCSQLKIIDTLIKSLTRLKITLNAQNDAVNISFQQFLPKWKISKQDRMINRSYIIFIRNQVEHLINSEMLSQKWINECSDNLKYLQHLDTNVHHQLTALGRLGQCPFSASGGLNDNEYLKPGLIMSKLVK